MMYTTTTTKKKRNITKKIEKQKARHLKPKPRAEQSKST